MIGKTKLKQSHGRRVRGMKWMHALTVGLLIAGSIAARAADERAIKSRVAPVYPELARRMHISGLVKLEATVDPDGKVTAVKTLSGSRALSQAAEDAVAKWKFVPAVAASTVNVDVNFAPAE
jgi:TonB family protein